MSWAHAVLSSSSSASLSGQAQCSRMAILNIEGPSTVRALNSVVLTRSEQAATRMPSSSFSATVLLMASRPSGAQKHSWVRVQAQPCSSAASMTSSTPIASPIPQPVHRKTPSLSITPSFRLPRAPGPQLRLRLVRMRRRPPDVSRRRRRSRSTRYRRGRSRRHPCG